MKSYRVVLAAVIVFSFSLLSHSQTAESVLNRAVEASGGAALSSVTSITMSIKGVAQGSTEMDMKVYIVPPDKFRTDVTMMGMVITQVKNGDDYWMLQGGTVLDTPEMQKGILDLNMTLLSGGGFSNLAEKGITAEYVGQETVDGKTADVISFKHQHQDIGGKWYFNKADGLLFLIKVDMGMGEVTSYLSDYRVVSGIKFPHHFDAKMGGTTMITMDVTEIAINAPVDASIFARPK